MTTQRNTNQATWTTAQLISLSTNMANVYGANTQGKKRDREDEWTTERLISLSQAFL
jgi:hypothetical protein